jgi:uncharacterized LabA/DUF88 family protein
VSNSLDQPRTSSPNRSIALLIDADNISHTYIASMIAELSKYGTANIRRAYGDWTAGPMKGWREKLHEFAIRPIQQFNYSSGKNATDIALVIDAMELHYTQKLEAFCIASSDGDFTPLIMQLRANGHDVYGFGQRKTPEPFVNACTTFLYLEELDVAAVADPELLVEALSKVDGKAESSKVAISKSKALSKRLSQDTKLITILRGSLAASVREDGWAPLSTVGNAIKRQAPIDPRNYKVKNFATLFEATGLFEIYRAESGHAYVSDKKNKERSKAPQGT